MNRGTSPSWRERKLNNRLLFDHHTRRQQLVTVYPYLPSLKAVQVTWCNGWLLTHSSPVMPGNRSHIRCSEVVCFLAYLRGISSLSTSSSLNYSPSFSSIIINILLYSLLTIFPLSFSSFSSFSSSPSPPSKFYSLFLIIIITFFFLHILVFLRYG